MYTLKNANTEYVVAHCSRLFDGLLFLFINTSVMLLQINDVLGLFLNFAALMWDLVSVLRLDYASLYHICFYNVLKTICIYLQVFTNNRQYCIANMLRRVLDTIAYGISARCYRHEVCSKAPLYSQLYADILCSIDMVWPRCSMGKCSLEQQCRGNSRTLATFSLRYKTWTALLGTNLCWLGYYVRNNRE